ncbi:MAG: hypothetical protein HZB53_15420 [Chloroflexi bacterium]|nr:hypothetical protein [Chloroflexota bacterium]
MSDWLLNGIAAAKSHDKEMACFYLERALAEWEAEDMFSGSPDMNDQLEAYYWLSAVTDDPAQKRDYLEQALAINPMHPESRRDLAIIEGRLKPAEIVDPDRVQAAVAPDGAPDSSAVRRFACPRCGGKLAYDPESRALVCTYCGHRVSEAEARSTAVPEQDFVATIYTAKAHRWELPAKRTLQCQACGARYVLPPARVAGACPFCASAQVVETTAAAADLIEPQGIVPFQFDVDACVQHIRNWLQTRPAAPGDLFSGSAIVRPRPVYLPFWIFDIGGSVSWSAMVEEYDALRRQNVWVRRTGQEVVLRDNTLVPATHTLGDEPLKALAADGPGAYDTKQVQGYAEEYLADWPAEVYQIAMADASLQARSTALAAAQARIKATILGEARDLSCGSAAIVINTYQLALLPAWVAAFRYRGRDYPLVVNGQTGAVHGDAPHNTLKRFMSGLLGSF